MPSDLTPSEREDRESERLINKKRAPSRKRAPKRGPKHDNRRRRVRDSDGDLDSQANRPAAPPRSATFHVGAITENDLLHAVDEHHDELEHISPKVAADFDKFAESKLLAGEVELPVVWKWVQSDRAQLRKARHISVSGSLEQAIDSIVSEWPAKRTDFGKRAGIIGAVRDALDKAGSGLPSSFTAPFRKSDLSPLEKKKLVLEILQSSGKTLSAEDMDGANFIRFGGLAALLRVVETNPSRVSKALLVPEVARLMEVVRDQAEQVSALSTFRKAWDDAIEHGYLTQDGDPNPEEPDAEKAFDRVIHDMDSALNRKDPIFPDSVVTDSIRESIKKKFGKIPKSLEGHLSGREASYGAPRRKPMGIKTATYHGVIDLHHPERASFGQPTVEKSDMGKKEFDSIVASAKGFLKDSWLKDGWEGSAEDAPIRAALDLAIYTADGSSYQSKVDSETYGMLLNRLAGWGYDQFEETILPEKARSASMSNQHIQTILRVASDLRKVAPDASMELVRSAQSLVASDDEEACDMTASGKPMDELKKQTKKLMDAKDIGEFVDGMSGLSDSMKTAGARTASEDVAIALTDLPVEDASAFHQSGLETAKTMLAALEASDLQAFCAAADDLVESAEVAVDSARVGTARVKLSTLVRLAHTLPGAREALLPVILAASKKKPAKKKPSSTSKGKKEEPKDEPKGKKSNPFAKKDDEKPAAKKDDKGKKVPFGGKKAPPFGKKKAHVAMSDSDADWG